MYSKYFQRQLRQSGQFGPAVPSDRPGPRRDGARHSRLACSHWSRSFKILCSDWSESCESVTITAAVHHYLPSDLAKTGKTLAPTSNWLSNLRVDYQGFSVVLPQN